MVLLIKTNLSALGKYGAKKILVHGTSTDDPAQLSKLIQLRQPTKKMLTLLLYLMIYPEKQLPQVFLQV